MSNMRKVFRAAGPEVVLKQFVVTADATPDGWHEDIQSALSNYQENANAVRKEEAPEAAQEVKPRRGRPRKEQ